MLAATTVHELSQGWRFKETGSAEAWMLVKKVPTNVHLDLIDNGKCADPFLGFNELDCQWVGEKSWTYETTIPSSRLRPDGAQHILAFDGLDTHATVRLNGKSILESDNMFRQWRVDVTAALTFDADNILSIEFLPTLLEARRIQAAHPEHKWVGSNGEMSRLAARKAQYHWGWDWGPILMTCGPWRAVRLEAFHVRIADLRIEYEVGPHLGNVRGRLTAVVEGEAGIDVHLTASLEGLEVFASTSTVGQHGLAQADFVIQNPRLWYPRGYGEQVLYTVSATVRREGQCLDQLTKRTGFRKGELVQDRDEIGKTFYFRFNDIDIFCGGSNWIPADSFTPRITKETYRKWLQIVADGNQAMIRVWGGGIWEEDVFYDTCDELGILVWQDFMFACGNYPAFPAMLRSIEAEAVDQVKRLRHHPCMAIYAGNNEDYSIREEFGLTYNYADKDPASWLKTDFPARYIYEKLLPDVVATHSAHIPYHPGSPWGDGRPTSDRTVGDLHQWNVWHGTQEKYQIFASLGGRFNSEFGMEAFPHRPTIEAFVTDATQLYPQSRMLDFHNKAAGHERRIAAYLVENLRATQTSLEQVIHLTQLSQAEALTFAYRGWRRQWGASSGASSGAPPARFCGGALVWQLNDCWPGTSWALVDHFRRKKAAWYAVRRGLAPRAVAVQRAHHDWSGVHARAPPPASPWACWLASARLEEPWRADVELRFVSVASGRDIKPPLRRTVTVVPNGTTDVFGGIIDNVAEEPHVLAARVSLAGVDGVVARDVDWPQPLKYLDFGDRGVRVAREDGAMVVTARKPTKGLVFEERDHVSLSDSALDVVPGDRQLIRAEGLGPKDEALKWTYLGAP